MSDQKRAAVIGAGLVGVATAIGLRRSGFEVEVFERRRAVVPDGYGIAITTNGMLALRELQIAEQISAVGARIEQAEIRDPRNRLISDVPLKRIALAQGDYSYGFTRRNLHQRLLELLGDTPIRTGAALAGISERGSGVVARFEDGREAEFDLLVGSDGVHSTTRRCLHGDAPLENSGYVAWLAIADHVSRKVPAGYGAQWWGRGLRYSVQYAGPQQTYWWGTQTIPNNLAGRRRKQGPVSAPGIDKGHFRQLFQGWVPELRDLIDEYLDCTPAESVIEINPRCHRPIARWSRGHVTLSGDAAHAMFPSLGTGASIGFEDAAVLMHCVRVERDVPAALALYDRLRVDRTNRTLKLAKQLCWLETSANRAVVKLRDAYFRVLPRSFMANQFLNFTDFQLPPEIAAPAVRKLGPNERWHWFSGQLNPLNTVCAFRLRSQRALTAGDFQAALARLQQAHEILNLTVKPSASEGLEFRRVARTIAYEQLPVGDVAAALELLNRRANTSFAPDAPLAKLIWAPLSEHGGHGVLCLVCSHLVADGTAIIRLTQELLRLLSGPGAAAARCEPLPAALEALLGEREFAAKLRRRAVVKQTGRTTSSLLRPGLRLPEEQPAEFEELESRFVQVALDEGRSAQLDGLCKQHELTIADIAGAALARALGVELGRGQERVVVRIGRSFSFREALAPEFRDALQSSVAQAACALESDHSQPLLELARRARSSYERLWREGDVIDGLRVLSDTGPTNLAAARRFAGLVRKSGPMHISVTDLSALPVQSAPGFTIADACVATTLSISGNLVLLIQRAQGCIGFNIGYAHPLVSDARAARISAAFQAELRQALGAALPAHEPERPRPEQVDAHP
jgi:2-polyprenyl-6-methoxyphenol hydroxylase-like FAD-dependent oxidoreductase